MKSTFKYLINKIDKIIIKGHHKTRWIQSGGENFISTIIASKIIIILSILLLRYLKVIFLFLNFKYRKK